MKKKATKKNPATKKVQATKPKETKFERERRVFFSNL